MIPIYQLAGPGYALLLAVALLAASGVGRVALGSGQILGKSQTRCLVAELVIGTLVWTVVVGVLSTLGVPLAAAVAVAGLYMCVGLVSIGWEVRTQLASSVFRLKFLALLTLVMLIAGFTPVNLGAADPLNYAFITSTLFRTDWLVTGLSALPDRPWYVDLAREGMLARSPDVALLWPAALAGWGLDARFVAGVAAWLLSAAFVLLVDVWHGQAPLVVRAMMAAGAIGAFNITAIVVGGQINQPFALAVVVACIWLYRWMESAGARNFSLMLCGAAITAGYPEFLAVLPLYFLCAMAMRPVTWRVVILAAVSMGAGISFILVCSRFATAEYLLSKVGESPGWWPLPNDPHNVVDQWTAVILQRLPPVGVLAVMLPALWLGWRSRPQCIGLAASRWNTSFLIASLIVLVALWSWLLGRAPNINYATFKVAGWLGPGLFILGWCLLGLANPVVARPMAALLVGLAAVRTLGLLTVMTFEIPFYAPTEAWQPAWQVEQGASGECVVLVQRADPHTVLAAISGSAAPAHGCQIAIP